jgi:hypothetical protein
MRSLVRTLILLLALGVFLQRASADDPPNVMFIAVDDLRDWVGHLGGHPQAKTPNIDRLAERGLSSTRAYCSAPLYNPSRISLLTGIAPSNSGVYGNGEKLRRIKRDSSLPKSAWIPWGPLASSEDEMFDGKNAGWVIAELAIGRFGLLSLLSGLNGGG